MIRLIVDEFNCNHQADVGERSQQIIYTREKEQKKIETFLEENIKKKGSGLMYLCGHPGTGKTSSLNLVLEKMRAEKDQDFYLFMFNAMTYQDVKTFLIILQ